MKWITERSLKGFSQEKEDMRISAKIFLDEHSLSNPFTDNLPEDGWYRSLLSQFKNVVAKGYIKEFSNPGETYRKDVR
ncbi:unnamed protein product [Acanthoscelides obtectus]|uniref:Uncharacterized protein n=1 Tax=Acanthoscelides obtectus TaxID=200917 RepID=A0A9P0Q381_ACAOB|nr:unnamed protein product [Acanthoscelides obtectus]CAK1623167.1 hypothetical protein AOBTE_LOCUS1850 [Acanthoscelides obtectus]